MSDDDTRWIDDNGDPIDEDHRGLVYDVQTLIDRRRALGIFGGVALTRLLAACGAQPTDADAPDRAPRRRPPPPRRRPLPRARRLRHPSPLEEVPDETGGPYPGDGSNGVNVLDDSGIVRSDIRSSFGSSTTVAEGVPLTIALTVRDAATGAALAGRGVYLWHCDRDGNYSLYSRGVENENYLRGVQETDANGTVTVHVDLSGVLLGTLAAHPLRGVRGRRDRRGVGTDRQDVADRAARRDQRRWSTRRAATSRACGTLSQMSLQSDMVFSDDGGIHQIATMSGSVAAGYTASLTIGV